LTIKQNDPKTNILCGLGIRNEENLDIMFKTVYTTGCKYAINSFLEYKHHLTALISIGFLIPQVIGIILMFAFISILQFLVIIETDKNELLYRQFKQSSHDLKNVSKLIIGTEKVHFLKKFNFKSFQAPANQSSRIVRNQKPSVNIYQIHST
jgi:hypothetical protein